MGSKSGRNHWKISGGSSKSPVKGVGKGQKKNGNLMGHHSYIRRLPKQIMSTLEDDIMGYTTQSS
jgi:hypothetical protein